MVDKNRIKGAAQKIKGQIKTAVGKIVGNRKTAASGKVDEVAGGVQNPVLRQRMLAALRRAVGNKS